MGGKSWRKVIVGGQSISCEGMGKEKVGQWLWGREQSQASSDDGEAGGSLEGGALCRLVETQDAGEDEDWGIQHV